MGQTARTTKLQLDLCARNEGGANSRKRRYLEETVELLDEARAFYLEFFLAHPDKLMERVEVISKQTGEVSQRLISADKLLTWAEFQTVATAEHPDPLPAWNFSKAFPAFPSRYRRSVIKDVIGKARGYLTTLQKWQRSGKIIPPGITATLSGVEPKKDGRRRAPNSSWGSARRAFISSKARRSEPARSWKVSAIPIWSR